jgi:hypothetical protein
MAGPRVQMRCGMLRNGWSEWALDIDRSSIVPWWVTIAPSLRLGPSSTPHTTCASLVLRKQSCGMVTSMYVQASVCDYLRSACGDIRRIGAAIGR